MIDEEQIYELIEEIKITAQTYTDDPTIYREEVISLIKDKLLSKEDNNFTVYDINNDLNQRQNHYIFGRRKDNIYNFMIVDTSKETAQEGCLNIHINKAGCLEIIKHLTRAVEFMKDEDK